MGLRYTARTTDRTVHLAQFSQKRSSVSTPSERSSKINPSLPIKHPLKNMFNDYHWTSTQCTRLTDQAWYLLIWAGHGSIEE